MLIAFLRRPINVGL